MNLKAPNSMNGAVKTHRQFEAWLPALFVQLNYPRTKVLIPEINTLSPETKIEKATSIFKKLLVEEHDPAMEPSRQWSLEYFQACSQGSGAKRQFLIDEGIFEDGERLHRPERVQPQMEIINFNPLVYQEPLREEVRDLTRLVFNEYFGVKNSLSFPDRADLLAALSLRIPLLKRLPLPHPRLKLSLLLKDYVQRLIAEAQKGDGLPLIAIFGPGKGEELIPLMESQFSVLCLDAQDHDSLKSLLKSTFDQAQVPVPEFVTGDQGADFADSIKTWERRGFPPTVFICAGIDFSREDTIPEELSGVSRVAASIYVFHEMCQKEPLIENMVKVSHGSVVIFDGRPSVASFDNMLLPITERCDTPITGHDAVITHLLCLPPEEMELIAKKSAPTMSWTSGIVGPPLPPPLFYRQQGAVIGHHN